jgi:hypothetical protein
MRAYMHVFQAFFEETFGESLHGEQSVSACHHRRKQTLLAVEEKRVRQVFFEETFGESLHGEQSGSACHHRRKQTLLAPWTKRQSPKRVWFPDKGTWSERSASALVQPRRQKSS